MTRESPGSQGDCSSVARTSPEGVRRACPRVLRASRPQDIGRDAGKMPAELAGGTPTPLPCLRPWDALVFALGMVGFALCAHDSGLIVLRMLGLALAGAGLAWGVARAADLRGLFGVRPLAAGRYLHAIAAVGLGAGLACYYRHRLGLALLPDHLTWFCLVAAGIGLCEEVAYRGFLQGRLRRHGVWLAVVGAAIAHAAYKCALFLGPSVEHRVDIAWLAGGTLVVGIAFGLMRQRWGSLLFPVLAHAVFDAVTYGDTHVWPWWV